MTHLERVCAKREERRRIRRRVRRLEVERDRARVGERRARVRVEDGWESVERLSVSRAGGLSADATHLWFDFRVLEPGGRVRKALDIQRVSAWRARLIDGKVTAQGWDEKRRGDRTIGVRCVPGFPNVGRPRLVRRGVAWDIIQRNWLHTLVALFLVGEEVYKTPFADQTR
jgi:hypothetical protein